jgi:hypothetical protein
MLPFQFIIHCSIPGTTKKKIMGLERGPLSLVSTTEELLDRKVAAPVQKTENTAVGIRHADHVAPSIRKCWQSLGNPIFRRHSQRYLQRRYIHNI